MADVILCGITHAVMRTGESLRLMKPSSTRLVMEKIVPRLAPKTLVIFEGWNGVAHPTNTGEHGMYGLQFDEVLWEKLQHVVLAGADPRTRRSQQQKREFRFLIGTAVRWQAENVVIKPEPTSLAEYREAVMQDTCSYELKSRPPEEVQRAFHVWRKTALQFDRAQMAAVDALQDEYDVIVIISGNAHSLAIHKERGWELQLCIPDTPEDAAMAYRGYLSAYELSA